MSKAKQIRLYLTLKEETRSLLEDWANQQGRHITNLANWLVEKSIKDAISSGEFKPNNKSEVESLAITYIQAIATSGTIGLFDLQKLADELNVPSDRLAEILKQAKGTIKNGNHN